MVECSVSIPVHVVRDSGQFVAHCPVLDLATSGRMLEQAQERFKEALDLFIEDLVERGTLDEVLQSHGWHKANTPKPSPYAPATPRQSGQ